jgi:hypothetical protein
MRVLPLSVLALGAAACGSSRGVAVSDRPPGSEDGERADISAVRGDLEVYTDGQGHMIALVEPDPERDIPTDVALFYGDGKTMHAVPLSQYHADGLKFEIGFEDPRVSASPAGNVGRELGKVTVSCYGEQLPLEKLPAAESQAMVGAASFVKSRTRHAPLALVRDGERYLYVDYPLGGDRRERAYRVFTGKQGHLEQVPVESSSYDDRANEWTFKTRRGVLHATRDRKQPSYTLTLAWEGKDEAWASLDRAENWRLIYEGLGIYGEGRSPTPCDPMLAKLP